MRLRLNSHATIIEISEQSVWFETITKKLQNTFAKTFWASHCLINLPIKGEESRRKLFLLELYKLCAKIAQKHDSGFLKRLLDNAHKPIKIQPKASIHPVKYAKLDYALEDKSLVMRLPKEETFLFWHCVHRFKTHEITHDFRRKSISFHIPTPRLKRELNTFMQINELWGYALGHECMDYVLRGFFTSMPQVNPLENHYKTLGISDDVELEIVRMHYLKLAKIHHPDLAANNSDMEEKTRKFQEIQAAYEAIKTLKKRAS